MSITVVIARDDVGAPSTREVFESGVKFTTEGGDLSILSDRPQLLAKYGSGNWLSVYIDDNVTVISEKPAESSDDSFDFDSFGDDSSSDDTSDATDTDGADADSDTAQVSEDEATASV
jgi:hypothetical protein